MSREAMSEQSSIHEGTDYDEVFPSGQEPEESFSWLSERETSAQSSDEEMESYGEKDEVVSEGEKRMIRRKGERVMGMKLTVTRRS